MPRTFAVDPVTPARDALPEIPYLQAVAHHVSGGNGERAVEQLEQMKQWAGDAERVLANPRLSQAERRDAALRLEFAETQLSGLERFVGESRPPEACSRCRSRLVAGMEENPFLAAVATAYASHRPLSLSPDMLWLLVTQGVAAHVNANAERLRARFVSHAGQRELWVERDDLVLGSPDNSWPEIFADFSSQIAAHVGPTTHEFFVPTFSTTGPVERAACEVTLMDAMRAYFRYEMRFVCGIPAIALEGTPDDWRQLASRAEQLVDFDLPRWRGALRPILNQFVRASEGDVDVNFWRSIYLHTPAKCDFKPRAPEVTGWVAYFFPYLRERRGQQPAPADWLTSDDPPGFAMSQAGGGVSVAPFQLHAGGAEYAMEFMAGFLGVAQDARTLALRPEIGWAVRQAPPAIPD